MNEEEKENSKNFRSLKFDVIMMALYTFSLFPVTYPIIPAHLQHVFKLLSHL